MSVGLGRAGSGMVVGSLRIPKNSITTGSSYGQAG